MLVCFSAVCDETINTAMPSCMQGTRASAPGADHPVQPSYTHSDSEQTWNRDVKTPSMASPTALKTTFYPGSSTGNRPEPESAKSSHRTATPNYLQPTAGHMPEPPAPRSWTPSKLSAGEGEMSFVNPSVACSLNVHHGCCCNQTLKPLVRTG